MIKKNPIIGIGTGDFPYEYQKINQINSPNLPEAENPHNMYVLVLMQLGFLGLASMLSIFYYQINLFKFLKHTSKLIKRIPFVKKIAYKYYYLAKKF